MINRQYDRFLNNNGSNNSGMGASGRPNARGQGFGERSDSAAILGGGRSQNIVDPQMGQGSSLGSGSSGNNGQPRSFDNSKPIQRYVLFVSRMQGKNIFEPNSQKILNNLGNLDHEFRIVCVQDIPKQARPQGLRMTPAILDTNPPGALYQGSNALNYLEQMKSTIFRIQPVTVNMGTTSCKLGFNCWTINENDFDNGLGLGMSNFARKIDGSTDPRYNEKGKISQEEAALYAQYRSDLDTRYEQTRKQATPGGSSVKLPDSLQPINDNIKRNQNSASGSNNLRSRYM